MFGVFFRLGIVQVHPHVNHLMEYGIDNSFECLTILGRDEYAVRFRSVLSDTIMMVDNFKVNINAIRKVLKWFMNTECIIKMFNKASGYKPLCLHDRLPIPVFEALHLQVGMQCVSRHHTLGLVDQKE